MIILPGVSGMTISIDDVRRAAELICGTVVETPCARSLLLSKLTGAEIVLKFENHQFTASFKDRGALVKLLSLLLFVLAILATVVWHLTAI